MMRKKYNELIKSKLENYVIKINECVIRKYDLISSYIIYFYFFIFSN